MIPASAEDDLFPSVEPGSEGAVQGQRDLPPQVAMPAEPPKAGRLAVDCLKAASYGLSNFKSMVLLVLYAAALWVLVGTMAATLQPLFAVAPLGRSLVLAAISAPVYLIVGGFLLRFYLDVVTSSLEGVDQAPGLPTFNVRESFLAGLKGLGILAVYVFPIVTIPLLPLGLLALAYSDDDRAYNVLWATRAALKRPAQLLTLWPLVLMWTGVATLAMELYSVLNVSVSRLAASTGVLGTLVIFLAGGVVIATLIVMFLAVIFRCIGMLGRHNPVLTDMLPDCDSTMTTVGFVAGGVILSSVVVYLVISRC